MAGTALLIIDVQEAAVAAGPYAVDAVLANISDLLSAARGSGVPVVFIQHDGRPGEAEEPHTPGWEIYAGLSPGLDEPIIRKRFNSAFRKTDLHARLQSMGADTLVVTGIQTEYCVDTTVRVAFELGYSVVVPEMANTTFDNGSVSAREIIQMVNHRIWADRFASVLPVEAVVRGWREASAAPALGESAARTAAD
jgi:nicotinamidase-related amidase